MSAQEMDNPLKLYMREIGKTPLLTREEEIDLANKLKSDDERVSEEARARLIESNLRLVVKIAHEFKELGMPIRDLISYGNIGLIRAVEKYDPTKGARFGTYSTWWIKQGIRSALDNKSRTIRIPVQTAANLKKIKQTIAKLTEELGREPSIKEISGKVEFSERTIKSLRMADLHYLSLEATMQDDEDGEFRDIIPDKKTAAPDSILGESDSIDLLHELLERLDPREKLVLVMRFGLYDEQPQTLKDVADKIGRTRERVRQIQIKALSKIEKMLLEST